MKSLCIISTVSLQQREAPLLLRKLIPHDLRMVRILLELVLKEREQSVVRVDESLFAL